MSKDNFHGITLLWKNIQGWDPSPPSAALTSTPIGAHCRMLTTSPDNPLCPHHNRRLYATRRLNRRRLLQGVAGFDKATDLNIFLGFVGHVLEQLALDKIDRHETVALASVSLLILDNRK
jgi:hypothetical protein